MARGGRRGGRGGRGEGGGRGERKRKRESGGGGGRRRIRGGRGGGGIPSGRDGFVTKTENTHPSGSPSMRDMSIIQGTVGTKALKPLKELWDYENIHIPRDLTLKAGLENVKNTLIQGGYYIYSIEAYAEREVFTPMVVNDLRGANVQSIIAKDYPDEDRECSDLAMMQRISEWVEEHDPPAPLLVLTTDFDFYTLIQTLTRPRYGFKIFVSSNRSAPKEFASMPSFMKWGDLVAGTLLDGKIRIRKNQRQPPPPPRRRPSPPRARPEDLLVPVYWDIGTCSIPEDVRAKDVFANLEAAVRAMGFLGVYSVTVCSRSRELNGGTIDMLQKSGMTFRSLQPPTKTKKRDKMERKGYPDAELGRAMHMWALERNPSPMLLISSDIRLSDVLSSIRRQGFEIILAHNHEAPRDFTRQASRCVIWSDRRAGTGLVTGGLVLPGV